MGLQKRPHACTQLPPTALCAAPPASPPPPPHEAHTPKGLGGFLYFLYLKQVSGKTELGSQMEPHWGLHPPALRPWGSPEHPCPRPSRPKAAGAEGGGAYFGCSG